MDRKKETERQIQYRERHKSRQTQVETEKNREAEMQKESSRLTSRETSQNKTDTKTEAADEKKKQNQRRRLPEGRDRQKKIREQTQSGRKINKTKNVHARYLQDIPHLWKVVFININGSTLIDSVHHLKLHRKTGGGGESISAEPVGNTSINKHEAHKHKNLTVN